MSFCESIYPAMLKDAVQWAGSEGLTLPVVWYCGQSEADWQRPGVREALCALIGRVRRGSGPGGNCGPWTARVVEHNVGAFTVPAIAISLEPFDASEARRKMVGRS